MEIAARQCGLSDDELDDALHFIHSKMGFIRYFPYKEVKNFVVINPQHIFDKITELTVNTFTFKKVRKQKMDDFKKRGTFSLVDFESIYSRTDSSMKAFQFLKLLEKLRITASFQLKGNVMYFFPCVLAHMPTSISPFDRIKKLTSSVPPLWLLPLGVGSVLKVFQELSSAI